MKRLSTELVRGAGVLLPISSLPSPYGIGTFGKEAYQFVNTLSEAKQKYWQVLPIGPTSYGDSPYQSFSAFAGNPYFIDFEILMQEGLLSKSDLSDYIWDENDAKVNYGLLYENRFKVLKKAFKNSCLETEKSYQQFCADNEYWLEDYCLYMAIKCHFNNKEWLQWDEDIRYRKTEAVKSYQEKLKADIDFWKFCQFKFYQQWNKLKSYANEKNIQIIGDIPLYVALDSADVWVHGDLFELDERKNPINIAGVPPDFFSATGQRWGNPLYDWTKMEQNDFTWWRKRMEASAKLYDVIRIDHFIGIVRYFKIPAESLTAETGKYEKGPGEKLVNVIFESIGNSKIIAEDLGVIIPEVSELMKETGLPGMKILQFAFNSGPDNEFLPHNFTSVNTVVYGGTHDNQTMVGMLQQMNDEEIQYALSYMVIDNISKIPDAVIRLGYSSIAAVAIYQMQDILKLDDSARMNLPSTLGGNWEWRMEKESFTAERISMLRKLTETFGR